MPERNSSSGDIIHVSVAPDQPIIFEFPAKEAFFGRSGNDLNITLESGEQIVTEDFFIADAAGRLPELQFADIPAVAGELFLAEASPELDIAPAAGEIRAGGGVNSYSDASGTLIGGLDGSAARDGLSEWSSAAQSVRIQSEGAAPEAPAVVPAQPVAPPVVQPPVTPDASTPIAYEARAVAYDLANQGQGAAIRFAVPSGANVGLDSSVNGFVESFSTTSINGVTYYEMQISAAGQAAMQQAAGSSPPDNVYDYITLNVDGASKVIQVILNQSGVYNSHDEDLANDPDNGGVPVPEWHLELGAVQSAERILGDASDEMWLNGNMYADSQTASNTVDLGGGDDAFTLGGSVWAQGGGENIINGGQGDNAIVINGWVYARTGGTNVIDAGDGDITVNGAVYTYEADGTGTASSNTLTGGNISIQQDLSGGIAEGVMAFRHDAVNTLEAQENINIDLSNASGGSTGIYAEGASSADILKAGGDIDISVVSHHDTDAYEALGIEANMGSTVTLDAGGDISVTAQGTGQSNATAFMGNSKSSLNAGGDVNFDIDGDRGASGIFRGGDLTAGGSINIGAHSANGTAVGLDVFGGGTSQVSAGGTVDISAHSDTTAATGINADNSAQVGVRGDAVNISAVSDGGLVEGISASSGSSVNILADAVNIDAHASVDKPNNFSDLSVGVQASDGSRISISADDISINAVSESGRINAVHAVEAQKGAATSVTLEGQNVSVSVDPTLGGYALMAQRGYSTSSGDVSANILAQGSTVVSKTGAAAFGDTALNATISAGLSNIEGAMYADGASFTNPNMRGSGVSSNIVGSTADDTVDVTGALLSVDYGAVRILTGEGDDKVDVTGQIWNRFNGTTTVDAGAGDDSISFHATGKVHFADQKAATLINAGEGDNAIYIGDGTETNTNAATTIKAGSGDDAITLAGQMLTTSNAKTTIDAGAGDNTVAVGRMVTQGNEYGVTGGTNIVQTGGGKDTVAIGTGGVAMHSVGANSSNTVSTGAGDDSINISGSVQSLTSGRNVIDAGAGDDAINLTGGASYAMYAGGEGSRNVIDAGEGNNTVNVNKWANATDGGANVIQTGSGDDVITFGGTVTSQTDSGGFGGTTEVDAGDGDNTLNFNYEVRASGKFVQGAGQPELGEGGSMAVSTGSGYDKITFSRAVGASAGSILNIDAGDGDNELAFGNTLQTHLNSTTHITTGSGDDTLNLKHVQSGADAHTVINTGSGNDTVTIDSTGGANVKGVVAYLGGSNTISSDTVNIHGVEKGIEADRMSYTSQQGYVGADTAQNVISAANVNISADNSGTASGNAAYAMYAAGKDGASVQNIVQAQGSQVNVADGSITFGHAHAVTVVISAASGSAEKAVALLAKGSAVNYIVGSELGDSITIQGHVQVEKNTTYGSKEMGENIISTGAGDDTVSIQGHVQVGALNIYAGEGSDTLVLVADSLDQFNEYYRDWLMDMDGTEWEGMGIESVQVQVSDPSINLADIAWLTSPSGVFASSGTDVLLSVNDDYDLNVNIDGYGDAGGTSLGELAGVVDGFDSLDMSGGAADTLNIDGLLDGLGNLDPLDGDDVTILSGDSISAADLVGGLVLRITGDVGQDTVTLGGNWDQNAAGSVEYGSVTYDIYTTSDADNQYVLVQQNLLMG